MAGQTNNGGSDVKFLKTAWHEVPGLCVTIVILFIQNWLSNGRSLDEIGGDDFQDFKFDYLVNDGGEKAKDNESTHQ